MDAWLYSHRIQVALMLLPLHLKNIAFLKNGACCIEEGQADYDKNAEDTLLGQCDYCWRKREVQEEAANCAS